MNARVVRWGSLRASRIKRYAIRDTQFAKRRSMMIYKSPFPDITIPNVTLAQYVLQHAANMRDQPALIDGPSGRTLTYGQLAGASRLIAASLAKRGLGKGDVLAIWAPNIPEYALPFLAVSMLGGINTTLNSLYTPDKAKFQLNDTG